MIWSALEVFKKECMGFILGFKPNKNNKNYFVTEACPYQSLRRRKNTEVELSQRTWERFDRLFFQKLVEIFPKCLGDFHSHPEWGTLKPSGELSDRDVEGFIKSGVDLEIVISISSRKKGHVLWESLPDGSVKGSFDGRNFELNAYTLVEGEGGIKVPQRLQIRARQAIESLNRAQ
jgi:proteasome lid subunit RPN8/RPN11